MLQLAMEYSVNSFPRLLPSLLIVELLQEPNDKFHNNLIKKTYTLWKPLLWGQKHSSLDNRIASLKAVSSKIGLYFISNRKSALSTKMELSQCLQNRRNTIVCKKKTIVSTQNSSAPALRCILFAIPNGTQFAGRVT